MAGSKTARRDHGTGSVYQRSADKMWVASLTLPDGPDGKRRRKVIVRKSKQDAVDELRKARAALDKAGNLTTSSPTMDQWLTYWLREVSAKRLRPKPQYEREGDVRRYVLPAIGKVRLDKLTPEHVRKVHDLASSDGRSQTNALRCHRLLSVALRDAMREGKVDRNVADKNHMDAPAAAVTDVTTLNPEQALTLLHAAVEETQGARWAYGLLTGARVGEVLGLEWDRVDWTRGSIVMSWQLQRILWQHGCGETCGYQRVSFCPSRTMTINPEHEHRVIDGAQSLYLVRPKTRAGWRVVPIVEPVLGLFSALWEAQGRPASGFVFCGSNGAPISPETDYKTWKRILERAGLPDMRRHDGRHSAATMLLSLGVDQEVVKQLLGHSSVAVTSRYQHVDITMLRSGLELLGAHLTLPSPAPAATLTLTEKEKK